MPISRGWIFWDKGINGDSSFADGELAWTSFDRVMRKANVRYKGFLGADNIRIHPTQKPIVLYRWLLEHYVEPGSKVLDSHLGSGSHTIAAWYSDNCTEFVGIEIDKDYFEKSIQRLESDTVQMEMFSNNNASDASNQLSIYD